MIFEGLKSYLAMIHVCKLLEAILIIITILSKTITLNLNLLITSYIQLITIDNVMMIRYEWALSFVNCYFLSTQNIIHQVK